MKCSPVHVSTQVLQQALGTDLKPSLQLQALRSIRQDSQQQAQSEANTTWQKACISALLPQAVAALHETLHSQHQQLSPDQLQVILQNAVAHHLCGIQALVSPALLHEACVCCPRHC